MPVYLFHFVIIYALLTVAGKLGFGLPPFWITGFLSMVATYVAAWISFTALEAPLMVFGRRLEGRTTARPMVAGGPKA